MVFAMTEEAIFPASGNAIDTVQCVQTILRKQKKKL
jgi:hypothetical protein